MVEQFVKSTAELNAAAVNLRQNGEVEKLRQLAKKWSISYEQTEDFICGKRYRLAEIPIAEKQFRTPFEKLREEMLALDDEHFASIIGWHLVALCRENEVLAAQVLKKHKSLQRCLDYITSKAFEIAMEQAKAKGLNRVQENTGLALSEREVFPWVKEYYYKDDETEVQKQEAEDKKKALSTWERVEQKDENKKTIQMKQKEKQKGKSTARKSADKPTPKQDAASQSSQNQKESKKQEDFGQISLFDLAQ